MENQLEDKENPLKGTGPGHCLDSRERREGAVKMLRFTARASLRGGNCVISRLLSTSIATIDTLPKNLVIDDASVLKEDSSKKK